MTHATPSAPHGVACHLLRGVPTLAICDYPLANHGVFAQVFRIPIMKRVLAIVRVLPMGHNVVGGRWR